MRASAGRGETGVLYNGAAKSCGLLTLPRAESKVIMASQARIRTNSTTAARTGLCAWAAARCRRWLPTLVAVVTLLVAWELWVDFGHVNRHAFSAPSEIVQATVDVWPKMWAATQVTIQEAVAGFVLAVALGILLGVLFYCSPILNAAFFPLLTAAQTMPLITIAPLFIIWFGFEISGKIAIVAVFSLFPIAVQTIRGLMAVPQYYEDVALTCGATRWWTLWHVKLRVAARQIFGGIRISASYLFATATTAEYMGARKGLGIWLQMAYNSFRTPLIFCATFMIVALTGVVLLCVGAAERLLLGDDDATALDDGD
ncbi:ABC transporter permease [Bifidobacterium sp. DSM 109958]|uniref:ABC transporter permease n=2 Tax=Bifidobacterium moraviense TaxID=2675323 RepID=A0A7Y0HYQ3_9BIFI|nr:ABC transporter permease [Bifidobacterium sp. DSM 109958]